MLIFSILGVLISCRSALGVCNGNCEEPTLLYDSLKCIPVYSSSDDCCPLKYDCSNIEENAASSEDKCYFEGKAYSNQESVSNDDIYGNCQVGCSCESKQDGTAKADFTCAALDCPEWLGYYPEPGCYLKYNLGECCLGDPICTESNSTCLVNGKTLTSNTKFDHPTEKCTECLCDENFAGEFKEPICKKLKCIEEITHQKQVYGFCAPTYITLGDCCPRSWICPKNDDQIEKANTTSENKCKFGTTLLNIGDKFSRTKGEGKLNCECRIPPYLTCIQNYEYTTYDHQ